MTKSSGEAAARIAWLGLGAVLLLGANGRWILPMATWFFAVGWLVYLDRSRPLRGIALAFALYLLAYFLIWQGIIPAPGILYYLVAAAYAVAYFLPFIAHRLWATGTPGFHATLVFPVAWVTVELVLSRWVTPYGSWASLAYTQSDFLALIQLASVTGTPGISFVLTWFASALAWMLRPDQHGRARVTAARSIAVVVLLLLAFGQWRLTTEIDRGSVRAAGLVPSASAMDEFERTMRPVQFGEALADSAIRAVERATARLNDDLVERTRREASAGARVIAWSETAGRVVASEEDAFIARVARLAADERVTVLLALGVWHPNRQPPFDNKVVAVDPTGGVAWHYHKAHPIIGAEAPFVTRGDGVLKRVAQSSSHIGVVICHDLDFPGLLRGASQQDIGLVVAPSDDWSDIAVLHARMAVFRAVENGVHLFRPTRGGRSLAVDTRGRVVSRVDFTDDAFVAHVSVTGTSTVYGRVGDLFSWLCVASLPVLIVTVVRRRSGKRTGPNNGAPLEAA